MWGPPLPVWFGTSWRVGEPVCVWCLLARREQRMASRTLGIPPGTRLSRGLDLCDVLGWGDRPERPEALLPGCSQASFGERAPLALLQRLLSPKASLRVEGGQVKEGEWKGRRPPWERILGLGESQTGQSLPSRTWVIPKETPERPGLCASPAPKHCQDLPGLQEPQAPVLIPRLEAGGGF